MTILVSDFINGQSGVRSTLIDANKLTWSDAELLGYLNEALRASTVKPDFYPLRAEVALVAGIRQELPAGGIAFLNAYFNSAANGGRVVTQVDGDLLQETYRFWPAGSQQAAVEHFTADPRDPRRFNVYPPNNGSGAIEILYGAVPPAVVDIDVDVLPVTDNYEFILKSFVLAKAYAKNAKRQDLAKTTFHMQAWAQGLGMKSAGQAAIAPKVAQSPGLAS